jgi:hypothetical protein
LQYSDDSKRFDKSVLHLAISETRADWVARILAGTLAVFSGLFYL